MINIGLIAHDGKKPEMVSFVLANKGFLSKANIYATGTTGGLIAKEGFEVTRVLSGPKGGDAQIATLVANGQLDVVVFFRDPLDKHPHEPDVQMLMRICDVHNVPLATNPKAALYLLKGFETVISRTQRATKNKSI
ncbi:MAG: methylglyoxal synthase [Bacteroidetes bacterium OLB9]|nr:MAG: methylglyoxal synthase [Bacteroidetes bacterium OLB9]MCZ2338264.1 methylglyoxal synthase [Chitinophagales bacterium]